MISHKKYIINNIITNKELIKSRSYKEVLRSVRTEAAVSPWRRTDPLILSSLLVVYFIYVLEMCPVYDLHSEYMVEKLKAIRTETMTRRTFCTHKHVSSFCSRREAVVMIRVSWTAHRKGIK